MRSKKLFLAVATLTSLTLLAAACGGSSDSSARTKNAALDSTTILATATSPTSISNATSMAPSTTMAVAPTTSVNPLACPITAVRTGGTGNSIPIRVTICRPLTNLQVSYWLGTNRLTYSVLLNVPNSTTYEFDYFARLPRYLGQPSDLPDSISLEPWFSDGLKLPAVRLPISTTIQSTALTLPAPTTTFVPVTTLPAPTLPPTTTVPPTTSTTPRPTCAISWDGATLTACKPFRELRYQYFGTNGALGGQLGSIASMASLSSRLSSTTYPGTTFARIGITFTDGSSVSNVDLKINASVTPFFDIPSPTTVSPVTTNPTSATTATRETCSISWNGSALSACKPFREMRYQYFGVSGSLGGQLGSTGVVASTSMSLSSISYPGTKSARISINFTDGSSVSNVDLAIGATVAALFSTPPTTTQAPAITTPAGCDLQVSYGAVSSPCGRIRAYTYQWHNGTKTISGTMSGSGGTGWSIVYLGSRMPPAGATGALMTFTFDNGKTTRSVLVPLNQPSTTIRAPF